MQINVIVGSISTLNEFADIIKENPTTTSLIVNGKTDRFSVDKIIKFFITVNVEINQLSENDSYLKMIKVLNQK